jgi:hypothetical protein
MLAGRKKDKIGIGIEYDATLESFLYCSPNTIELSS